LPLLWILHGLCPAEGGGFGKKFCIVLQIMLEMR
jgi:hypothetical protein